MNRDLGRIVGLLVIAATAAACSPTQTERRGNNAPALPPEPVVTYVGSDAASGQRIEHGELIDGVDEARQLLHAQHHPHTALETRRIPGRFAPSAMTSIEHFALSKQDLVVINPGPGEYVHVMEGQRHGYRNLTVGITYTAPGGAPPMHTHVGEEAHVLLEGQILYALGDEIFTMEGPYIVNIPPTWSLTRSCNLLRVLVAVLLQGLEKRGVPACGNGQVALDVAPPDPPDGPSLVPEPGG